MSKQATLRRRYLRAWKTWVNSQSRFMNAIEEVTKALGRAKGLAAMKRWENEP